MIQRTNVFSMSIATLSVLCLVTAGCSKKEDSATPVPAAGVLPAPFSVPAAATPSPPVPTPAADASNRLPEDRLEPASIEQARLPGGAELKTEPTPIPSNSSSKSK